MTITTSADMTAYATRLQHNCTWTVGDRVVRCIFLPKTGVCRFEIDQRWRVPSESVDRLLIGNPRVKQG